MIIFTINWFETIGSTNDFCMKQAVDNEPEGLVIAAKFQEQGRGQRGNSWESDLGKNLTFSVLLRPTFLRVEQQFFISKVVAVSICEWLKSYKIIAKIKWPNDIYINDLKVGGVLIENSFSSSNLDISVVGVGINVNQTAFSSDIPNPTSISIQTGANYTLELLIADYLNIFSNRYLQLRGGYQNVISNDYFDLLYRRENYYRYSSREGEFDARIIGIKPTGELLLETKTGIQKSYGFKEVSFILKS